MLHAMLRAAAGGSALQALIDSLFGAGEQGAFYIPQPVVDGEQALYQDAAGTTAVTADSDPAGLMLDQSSNGNDASQGTGTERSIYKSGGGLQWLNFDGVDDDYGLGFIASGTGGSAFMLSVACEVLDNVSQGDIFEGASNAGESGGRILSWQGSYSFQTGTGTDRNTINSGVLNSKAVLTLIYDGANMIVRVNGVESGRLNNITYASATANSRLGSQDGSGEFAEMDFYGALSYVGAVTQTQIDDTEAYLASLAGVTL
jgi:hypothetical protein